MTELCSHAVPNQPRNRGWPLDGTLFDNRPRTAAIFRELAASWRTSEPEIAARLLASFIKANEQKIKEALLANNLASARRLVNGGSHGLDAFTDAYRIGQRLIPNALEVRA